MEVDTSLGFHLFILNKVTSFNFNEVQFSPQNVGETFVECLVAQIVGETFVECLVETFV